MARSRNIKPGYFKNEVLGTLDPFVSLLFAGLWTLADKSGILEDRPLRIKAELFAYRDSFDINGYLKILYQRGFIYRYEHAGTKLIQIAKFSVHQNPHHTEKNSIYPEYISVRELTVKPPLDTSNAPADSLNTDSLIPDSSDSDSLITPTRTSVVMPDSSRELTKKGTLLPEDWTLPKAWGLWALEYSNLTESQIRLESDKFKDYWHANANQRTGMKSSWLAAWRNWIRNVKPDKLQAKIRQVKETNEQALKDFVCNESFIEGEIVND